MRTQAAYATLETAICLSLLLPILYMAYAVFDLWQELRAVRTLAVRYAQEVPVKPMHLHSGWHGFYVRARDRTPGIDSDLFTVGDENEDGGDPDKSESHLVEHARQERDRFYSEFISWFEALKGEVMSSDLCRSLSCRESDVRIEMLPALLQINQNTGEVRGTDYPDTPYRNFGTFGTSKQAVLKERLEAFSASQAAIPSALHGSSTRLLYGIMSGRDFGATEGILLESDKSLSLETQQEQLRAAFLQFSNARRGYVRFSAMIGIAIQIDTSKSFFASLLPTASAAGSALEVIEVATLRKGF